MSCVFLDDFLCEALSYLVLLCGIAISPSYTKQKKWHKEVFASTCCLLSAINLFTRLQIKCQPHIPIMTSIKGLMDVWNF